MPLKLLKALVSGGVLIGAFLYVAEKTDWPPIVEAFSKLPWPTIALATLALLIGALLASLRLQWIAADLGYPLSFRDSVSALSMGQVMGVLFFQIAGQLIARSTILSLRQIPASGTIVITGYERVAALAVSLTLGLLAAMYLFGSISIDLTHGGATFIELAIGLLVATGSGAAFAWGRLLKANFPTLQPGSYYRLARNIGLSIAIQISTMTAYVLLAQTLAPQIALSKLVAASALVMLAAGVPISLAGWGIREMSAIFVLGAIGVSPEASLTVAVTIGVLSLAVVGSMTLSAIGHAERQPVGQPQDIRPHLDYGTLLDYALPVVAATAVFFQIFLPLNKGTISANLGEPVVILGGCLFVLRHVGHQWPAWRLGSFTMFIGMATVALVAAYLHGLLAIGWSDWAFANRFLGWPILLCYGATGALIARHVRDNGFDILLRTIAAAAVAITIFNIVTALAFLNGMTSLQPTASLPLLGFSQNRNTFAFQLLLTTCVLLSTRWRRQYLWLGIITAGIVLTGSRAVLVALAVVMVVTPFVAPLALRTAAAATAIAAAIISTVFLAPGWINSLLQSTSSAGSLIGQLSQLVSNPTSDLERLKSIIGGWEMFLDHPIFGAGLGAYMEQQTLTGTPLVIHSTPMWLLAELGFVGFAVMVTPIVLIFRAEITALQKNDIAGKLLVLIITAFSVMSLAHEIMFQRVFWLLLGACMAVVPAVKASERNV